MEQDRYQTSTDATAVEQSRREEPAEMGVPGSFQTRIDKGQVKKDKFVDEGKYRT